MPTFRQILLAAVLIGGLAGIGLTWRAYNRESTWTTPAMRTARTNREESRVGGLVRR